MARRKLTEFLRDESPPLTDTADAVGQAPAQVEENSTPFLPSIFQQLDNTPGGPVEAKPTVTESPEDLVQLDAEDLEILMELPFDAAASFTRWPGWTLAPKETKALAKLWLKPLRRWLRDVENLDVYMACLMTATIIGEKTLGYKIEQQARARSSLAGSGTGNAGVREDELRQELHQ